jgi:hypothetical protein
MSSPYRASGKSPYRGVAAWRKIQRQHRQTHRWRRGEHKTPILQDLERPIEIDAPSIAVVDLRSLRRPVRRSAMRYSPWSGSAPGWPATILADPGFLPLLPAASSRQAGTPSSIIVNSSFLLKRIHNSQSIASPARGMAGQHLNRAICYAKRLLNRAWKARRCAQMRPPQARSRPALRIFRLP